MYQFTSNIHNLNPRKKMEREGEGKKDKNKYF